MSAQGVLPSPEEFLSPAAPAGAESADPVDKQFQILGYAPDYPPETIRGVRLTPDQYDEYVKLSGKLSKMQLDKMIVAPQWNAIPAEGRLDLMKGAIQKGRDIAATAIMIKAQGSGNDIMRRATDAKLSRASAANQQ
jgi:hypothetical protein